ncbi:hypothetical protein [Endozoicomonas sp. 8E]|uniref:hypothetical protein n=1 Tax=Endozoicomonas sp. 8E TaxID=3035692 RepID=UPI0029395351|nr:hypothetical protein [Endozoicomonas sp. 8E]WOG26244.1 hypothetical protein P6910_16960 [Endozoicomonas sp. 8E]
MSYGLPSTTSAATSTTPQLPQKADSVTTERQFTLNPEAAPFVPRDQGVDQWNTPSTIRDRQATRRETDEPQKFHQWRKKKTYTDETVKRINDAYDALKTQKFSSAEVAFRSILRIDKDVLSQYDYQKMHIGLARSLNEQTREKQEEACSLLKELRSNASLNKFGASTIFNLDLTLSRSEQTLGRYLDAETRLLRLRNKKLDADLKAQCEASDNFDADIAIARLWQLIEKHTRTETLLLNVKSRLTEKLQSKQSAAAVEKLHQKLRMVNIAMARLWQVMGKSQWAEDLLLNMSGKHPSDREEVLCKPSRDLYIDLSLTRHWELIGKYKLTEKLLLNLSGKHPSDTEEELCKPCKHHGIDLTLVRHWELTGKYKLAEKLLLNMSGKNFNSSEEDLCKPCGHHEIDMTLMRLWQIMGKHKRAEKLLLNMSSKHPDANEETLCTPCGNYLIDLALVRYWELVGNNQLAEKLLLNMTGKHPDASEEELCKPCWLHDIDLTLARYWEIAGKYNLSERLLLNMIEKHPDDSEEILCQLSGHQYVDLALVRLWQAMDQPERSEKLLLNMCGKSLNDCQEDLCKPCGHHDVDLTLVCCWETTGRSEWAERLLRRCRDLYHTNECEYLLLSLSCGQPGFMEMISHYPESANTLQVTSIHYFKLACERIIKEGPKAGNDNLNKSLEILESLLEKYPPNAGAYSQKAHCLRMLGRSEQEWRKWFDRAESLDPGRAYKSKTHFWRRDEAAALQKVLAS